MEELLRLIQHSRILRLTFLAVSVQITLLAIRPLQRLRHHQMLRFLLEYLAHLFEASIVDWAKH